MKRIVIGGTHSGCGKTTVTCAVLAALKARGLALSSFKCGPDYIDPMFHRRITGVAAHNLDSRFCRDDMLRQLLCENSRNSDISVIEGVMGYFDGADGRGSAYSVSLITDSPAVVVIDCKGASESIGAVVHGFMNYRAPNNIKGFIFNRLPDRLVPMAERICAELGAEYFGFLPSGAPHVDSRRLGLVTADEIADIQEKLAELGRLAEKHILLDKLLMTAEAPEPEYTPHEMHRLFAKSLPKIAVASDNAFCFIYSDNISILEKLGCRIEYFSPIHDDKIPADACGLILSGGYPELYAGKLSANPSMRDSVRNAVLGGMPTIAECGGFMYLHDRLRTADGTEYLMAGVINAEAFETDKLRRFGYADLTAEEDSLLFRRGDRIPAHEFHYWDSTDCGSGLGALKTDGRSWECVHTSPTLYAGFPHLYFGADVRLAERFAAACGYFGGLNGKDL